MDYVIVLKTLQSLANDETQLSLPQINKSKNCALYEKCKAVHPSGRPYHKACKRCHKGGDDACWLLYPELRGQWQQAKNGEGSTFTPAGNLASFKLNSGITG